MNVYISRAGMVDGARTALPLAVGAGVFAAALGVLAAAKGVSALEMGLMSLLMLFRPGRAEVLPFAVTAIATMALVTPALVSGGPAEWLGAATAIALMALSRNLLASITGATVVVALVRAL
jgi:hypothetical protein